MLTWNSKERESSALRQFASQVTIKRLLGIILGATLARAVVAANLPLIPDEAYYWLWAHHLDWSYLDQPPMVAYLIFLTTLVGDSAFWLRLAPLLLGAATSYALFLLGRELFDEKVGLLAATIFQVVPILWLGGLFATPDGPLYLAWTLALRFVWQALHGRPERWTAAGLAIGFGLLSKPYIAFLVIGAGIFIALYHRPVLGQKGPYLAATLAGLLFLPVIYWNFTHHWAAVRFILYERSTRAPHGLAGVGLLLQQYLEFVVVLLPAFLWALWAAWRHRKDERFAYLLWTSLPAVVFPVLTAPGGAAFGHWLGPAHLALAVVLGARWTRAIAALATGAAALVVITFALVLIPSLPPPPGGSQVYGWQEMAIRARQEAAGLGKQALLVTDSLQIAAQLSYYTQGAMPVFLLPHPNPASIWPWPEKFIGAPAVAVTYLHSTLRWERCFERVEELTSMVVRFRGWPSAEYRVFRLYGFLGRCL